MLIVQNGSWAHPWHLGGRELGSTSPGEEASQRQMDFFFLFTSRERQRLQNICSLTLSGPWKAVTRINTCLLEDQPSGDGAGMWVSDGTMPNRKWKWKWSCSVMLTFCDPMAYSLLGFSVHGILQARILKWVAISFSRGSFWHRAQTRVSHTAGRLFTIEPPSAQQKVHSMLGAWTQENQVHREEKQGCWRAEAVLRLSLIEWVGVHQGMPKWAWRRARALRCQLGIESWCFLTLTS